ncbi:MAG: branched-chain amino acid ABC transporter permease [Eubacteriales bacterium]|nr:branched-chain amino acid ABC transporter permease [Eubacteriales bacterium]MDD4390630.1 branched-chain amino acid ABC transporter permease [Eubacteriales bacterium]
MLKGILKKQNSVLWIIAIASIVLPLIIQNRYYQDIIIMTFLWTGLAASWNFYSGYCGRLSIGHAAFLGIGAYATALLYANYGISPWIGILVGGALSAIVALIIGGATLRLQGTFFVLSTIAFAKILETFAITAKGITGGSLGVLIPYTPGFLNMTWSGKLPYAIIAWAYMIIVIAACVKLEKSKLGYFLKAVGENKEAAENLGVNSSRTMLKAFLISAVFTSFGGSIMAMYVMYIEPSFVMSMGNSVQFILLAIAGGLGTAFGPLVGSFILVPVTNILRGSFPSISGLHGLLLGLILIVVLLYRTNGILPALREFVDNQRRRAKNDIKS